MNAGMICSPKVITITPQEDVTTAARLMREKHVGFLVVVEPGAQQADVTVTGVLTDRDIVTGVIGRDADVHALKVGDVMTRNPLLTTEEQSVEGTLRDMRARGVRRVPVVGDRDELKGVLSLDDILNALADQLNDVAASIRNEQRVERAVRR